MNDEQRERRREHAREYFAERYTDDEFREKHLAYAREYIRARRADPAYRAAYNESQKLRARERRAMLSPEEHEAVKTAQREYSRKRRERLRKQASED